MKISLSYVLGFLFRTRSLAQYKWHCVLWGLSEIWVFDLTLKVVIRSYGPIHISLEPTAIDTLIILDQKRRRCSQFVSLHCSKRGRFCGFLLVELKIHLNLRFGSSLIRATVAG